MSFEDMAMRDALRDSYEEYGELLVETIREAEGSVKLPTPLTMFSIAIVNSIRKITLGFTAFVEPFKLLHVQHENASQYALAR